MGKELPQGHLLGDYKIQQRISRTGLQTVYIAQQVSTGRSCRLIVFNVDPDGDPWQSYQRDLSQIASLEHPMIAERMAVDTSAQGLAYAVFAQPPGETLALRLRRGGALTLRELLIVARQVAAALHAVHRIDMVHGALTPENIYLISTAPGTPAPEYEPVLLYGFGMARLFEGAFSNAALCGPHEYLAPEQIAGMSIDIGPATDQYALALIAYQALSASQPFRADSPGAALLKVMRSTPEHLRALRPDLPSHVDTAVARGLAKERQARFADLPAFIAELIVDEKLPDKLLAITDTWLGQCTTTEEVLSRAIANYTETPSLGVLVQSLADGIPQSVEDGATVPNTMEDVMRLAIPPEHKGKGISGPIRDFSGPIEITEEASKPQPLNTKKAPAQAGISGPRSAEAGNKLAMRSGETHPVQHAPSSQSDATERDKVASVIVKGDAASPTTTGSIARQAGTSSFARMLPAILMPYASGISHFFFLGIGILLGCILHGLLK